MQKEYWMDELKDINSFYNFLIDVNSFKTFDKVTCDFSNDVVDFEKFLTENNVSFFEFYTSIISLYLSRTTNSNGVIFSYSNLDSEDTLFKIKYDDNISIFDFIVSVKNTIDNALDNSMVNLRNYVKELYPDYCDYIFNYTIVNQTNGNYNKNKINSSIIFKISSESIEVEYDINTFTRFEIESMLENIEALLYNCLKDINQHCGDVDIVCNRQLDLLNDFSKGDGFELDDKLLPDIILEMAEKYPDNFAINDEINRITYKELADLIPSLTYTLQHDYNIGKSDKIVLYLPRSYHVPLLTVCLMRLGAVTIPVDDSYPKDYIQSIINNSSPKYIIHELDYDFDDVESIWLNDIENNETGNLMDVDVDLDDTALILYTSGSTGVPKGVELTQRNIINTIRGYFNRFNFHEEGGSGNFMILAKFTFVASISMYLALTSGFEVFIIRETTKDSIAKIVKYLKTYDCYSLTVTAELGLYLYNNFDLNLGNIFLAGSNLLKLNIRDDSPTVLWNAYGCTETSGGIIVNMLNNDSSDFSIIGRPFGNVRVYILDDNRKQLPIGAVGELVIGGPIVTKQYSNNPEQTSKAYGEFNGERVFFTNDLAYFKPDGSVVYVGRKDNQINLNGFRIEPDGVQSVISEFGGFNQVKVVVGKVNRQDHLIAYYSSDVDIDEVTLKEYLSVHLPSYMVPSFYVRMDSLPVNPNGKIDVKSLPPVELEDVDFVKPRNELEEIVVDIFERVFNQENISVYDDFIQLGGTSIIAMKIVKELVDYNLSVNDLISLGTPEKIAGHIQNNTVMDLDMGRYSLDEGCPLNESQLNVYLDIVRYEKNDVYNIPFTINIPGTYSADDIKDALFEMFNVHPILKSFVNVVDGVPCLKAGFNPIVDFSNEYDEDVISDFMNKSFDLNNNLSRFLLVEKDDEEGFVLVCVFHHLIFDGFSSLVFKEHLFDLLEGKVLKLDEGIVKSSVYNECIVKAQEYSDAEAFYESMLCDAAEVSSFLSDVGDNKAGLYSFDLSMDKSEIDVLLKSLGVSENILFTGVFAYTLSRFTGDNKVLFNVLDNGRDKLGNYESIGMFVNTLPLLVDCSDKDPVSFMDDVKDLIFNVFSYNFYPFRVLAQKFNINSSILFQYQPIFDEVNGQFFNVSDFEFRMFAKNNRYVVNVIYSDVFSLDTIRRFVESYDIILNQLLSVNKLSDINYISSSDLEFLNNYNETSCELDYVDILDGFNANLSKYPDNVLVSYEDRSYTYGEGAFIANKISDRLIDLDVVRQDYVALFIGRSEWYLLASLGVLTCGAVYVPIETSYPDDRIVLMLNDTQSDIVIVDDNSEQRMNEIIADNNLNITILNVSSILDGVVGSSTCLDVVDVDEDDVACVLYTSGTTGTPKGVLVTRKALNNFVSWYVSETNFTSADVYGMYCSYVFDMHAHALYSPIITGGSLCVVPEDIRLDLKALNDYFVEHGCTHTYITSQVGKLFAESGMDTSIKLLCFGGMKLGELDAPDSMGPFESYGPSENLAISTSIFANKRIDPSSIGYFVSNVKGYVLDDECRRVPVGAVGELYLAGYQVSKGYLNRDGETKHSFISNVFDDDEDYGVLYRTGDLVRFLPDGSLGIVGRRDSQVKIRGNRVELGEVESVIRDMDIVEDVTVWTIDNEGNNELVAYVVLSDEMDDVDLLGCVCDFVGERKPDYMVPSYVVELDEVPLTVNGKVDKGALPEVDLDVLSVEYVAPVSETEKLIVDAFELVFDYKGLGLYDDFVRLGGDSIGAIRVVSLLEKDGVSCSAKDILNYKTPYLIAQHIDDNIEITSYGAVEGVVDLLPIQSYFFNQVKLNNFTQHFVLKFNTDVDVGILQKSLDELINLHDMLRAVYRFDGDNVIQEVLPLNSHICDIKEYNIEDNFDENIKNIFVKSTESINVENKLMDVNLVRYNDESYLMLIIHHLIVDGVSWNILLSDLTDIYYRLLKGENLNLVRPYPYKLWVENVKDLVDDISDSEKQYWINVNSLLDDSSIKGQSNVFVFSVDCEYDVDNLLMLSEEEYLALVISRAYKKTYGEDIIFNRESYGRDETIANLNRTIGWFTSQYPVPVNVNNGYDDVSLMRDVYNIKRAFGDVGNLGLNYASLIYTTGELEFKHCLVTFNFLSTEFVFKNELFESVNHYLSENIDDGGEINIGRLDFESYGVTFNVSRVDGSYVISGDYAEDTYLGDKIDVFFDNIKDELSFIANYKFDTIVCCLSEAQLGVYLDEKVYDKGTAYSVADIFDCGSDYSVDEVKGAIYALIDRHPILKGRVLDNGDLPLLVCDSYPEISVSDVDDYSKLIKPFDLEKSLSRFFIVDNDEGMCVVYDMHHVISDATSRTIINRDLGLALNGKLDDGLDLGFVYASCDSFESQFKPEYDSAHGFFREMFVDIDEVSSFLNDVDGVVGSVGLPIRGVREDVLSFVHDRGITVSSFLNAVFAYTYSRFVGGGKVCYNFTENGRHEYYAQDALGMFIRTVPVIVDCSNKSVGDFLSGVYDLVLEAMGSSVYPFRLLASEFGLSNSVSFEYNYDLNDTSGVGDEIIFSDEADCVSDLLCVVNDLEDGFLVSLNHSDNFSQDSAERFVKVFRDVLVQFLDNEELCDIDYISNDDVLLLDSYNDTEYDLDYVDVLEAFNDNLSKFPDDMLVSYGDCSYTYSEGAFVAGKIASCLKDLGVEEQDKIAFLVERSELYMFCVLGILSCGAVYVPLDDKLPDERISFILDDTSTNVLIVSDETYNRVVDLVNDDDVVILNISDIVNGDIGTLSKLSVGYGDLACILYTSGTTGVPKGVKVTRKSLINVCENYIENYSLDSNDVYGLFSAIGFDMATMVINLVICAGGCLAVVPDNVKLDILKLNDYIVACDVSHVAMPTPVGKLFMESIDETSLDVLLVGGEMLGDFVCSGTYRVVDGYGPTESFAFICSIDKSEKIDYSSIGFINSNVKVYVLDNEMRRVPMGAVGELYISGYQLADGYLNRDEETDYAFVDNSYDDNDGFNRLYRTGDMVRFLPDGSLGIVGRRDSQVKIRGNRVELGEVESVIRNIDFVENVTVQTIRNDGVEELVAYVVVSGDEFEGNLRELVCDYINTRKPDYMVPSYVVMLNEIPLTVNGKVDRGALPDVDVDSLSVEYVAPRSETEKAIVDAFEKVLNCENIGVYDDFVRLGGDSLSAIKLLTYLDGFNISVGDVLSLRTPSAISNSIGNISFDLDVYSLDSGCPLNEPQLNVYLDIKTNDKKDAYLIPLVLNISDEYSVEDIKSALAVMFDVHPVLGMCVSDDFDVPYLIKGQIPSIMVESDVNNDFIAEFLTKPFDLYDSLCRFLIVEAKDSFILYSVFHHIIFDAISEEVFKRNLYSILDGGVVGVDDSFLKVSAFSQQISESNDYAEAEEFYDSMLVDVDEASDLLDCILADGPGSTSIGLDIDNELLNSFLERHNLSLNVFFSSVFAYTLSRFVGSEKILFNIVENGRDRYGNYNSIGMFVNTLPLLIDCKNQEIASFVEYVSRVVYGVMRYNYYPFRLLANNYDIKSDILFQFLPGWVMDTNIPDMVGDVEYDDLLNDMGGLNADFSVKIIQGGNDYLLSVVYSDKYSRDFIDRFVKSYKLILNDMLNVGKLGDISYVSCDDLTLLDKFNETEMDLDYEDVLDAFNANLVNCLDNVLVSYMDRSYSYGEGAFIADKIAKSLTNFGLKSGDCVGFLVPRSELYMFSVLGILSCGGVFVPLDDDLPDERLSIILEDSDCKIVIVSNDTNERLSNLEYGGVVLNISNIVNCDNGSLSYLPVTYGDCACILYTSGSTGVPKGVKVTRKALVNVASFYVDTYGLSCDDVYGLYPSIGFDAGCESLFKAIYAGACLSVVPDDLRYDMLKLNNYFINQNVTHTMMTTQVGKLFMDSVDDTSLEYLFVGGEKLGDFKSPESYVLVDEYGPTETNNFISSVINSDKVHFSSVGHLNYNSKAYILDDEFRPVPVGAVGELFIAGYQLASGYLNRDDETNYAFVDNPFDDGDYGLLYRTGDMVRLLPDGSLGIVGRRDSQIKVRGNRVDLGELESVIRNIDFIEDITVQAISNEGNNELVVYVVLSDVGYEGNLREFICDYVAKHKPDYMVPSYVVELDEIPLTVNGKVDKKALPDIDLNSLVVDYVAPSNETEKSIVHAFEAVFNQKGIGLNDDFIRLGGDSIRAIRLISLLEKDGISCSARDIFKAKTPYNIAKLIDNGKKDYGFVLEREGTTNQNMFILPPAGGLAMIFNKLIKEIDFDGNIYTIDDYQYELTIDEIRKVDGPALAFEKYWEAIGDIFQDGDILVGYSLGCLHASLLCERLEKYKKVDKCVLIDGTLNFVNDKPITDEDISSEIKEVKETYLTEINDLAFEEKIIEVFISNFRWNLAQPKLKSHVIYLTTANKFKDELDKIASDYEFINIDSTHEDIIDKDVDKILKYLN